jgi:hypothetical protein
MIIVDQYPSLYLKSSPSSRVALRYTRTSGFIHGKTVLANTKSELFFSLCTEKGLTLALSQPFSMKLPSS